MALPWGLIVFLVGIAYGWLSPGREDKGHIFKMGLLWGLIVSLLVAVLGYFFGVNALGLADNGFVSNLIAFVVLTVVFIVGAWIGDMIEGRRGSTRGMRRV